MPASPASNCWSTCSARGPGPRLLDDGVRAGAPGEGGEGGGGVRGSQRNAKKVRINYLAESKKYRPRKIRTLLVGEAPPPSGRTYFYFPTPTRAMNNKRPIRKDTSLPSTIFWHYFGERPTSKERYIQLLNCLKNKGIFLVDIVDRPLRVRIRGKGIDPNALRIIKRAIPRLRTKLKRRKINVQDKDIVFLLPRCNYKKRLEEEFPRSSYFRWIEFRLSRGTDRIRCPGQRASRSG